MDTIVESSWPSEYFEMKRIEELLKCGICYDFIDTSVMTPCSHNYCSLCIRKYLHYKTQCPTCFQMIFEKDLHTNRVLDELIIYFMKIRSKLVNYTKDEKAATKNDCAGESCELSISFQPTRPPRSNHCNKQQSKLNVTDVREKFPVNKLKTEVTDVSMPCTSSNSLNTPIKSESNDSKSNDKYQVPCPICQVKISQVYINKHFDKCTKRESTSANNIPIVDNSRKLMPKLVFNLMKDSELRKKMKVLNLPTQGDRKTLENRFQRYCTLYNAEFDKIKPRSNAELLEQCKNEEMIEKKMAKSSLKINKVSRNAEQSVIDEANKKYLEMNANSYQNLIESIKNHMVQKKSDNKTELNSEAATPNACKVEDIPKHDEKISQSNNSYDEATNTEGFNNCQFIWPKIINQNKLKTCNEENDKSTNDQINTEEQAKIINSATNKSDSDKNKESHVENNEKCLSINCCISSCHAIRKRNHNSFNNNDEGTEFVATTDAQPTASLSVKMYRHDKNININYIDYTDDSSSQSVELNDCTMKRRRRQNRVISLETEELNPPSRPARKRSSTISCNLVLSNNT